MIANPTEGWSYTVEQAAPMIELNPYRFYSQASDLTERAYVEVALDAFGWTHEGANTYSKKFRAFIFSDFVDKDFQSMVGNAKAKAKAGSNVEVRYEIVARLVRRRLESRHRSPAYDLMPAGGPRRAFAPSSNLLRLHLAPIPGANPFKPRVPKASDNAIRRVARP